MPVSVTIPRGVFDTMTKFIRMFRRNLAVAMLGATIAACGGGGVDSSATGGTGGGTGGGGGGQNNSPTIGGVPITIVLQNTLYSFTPTANDADGDSLTFSISNEPGWASFDTATGTLTGTPTAADAGTYTGIVISVTDGTASASLSPFDITVTQIATGSVTLSWTPPTENADGTALTDLAGYRIYYGTTEGDYPNMIDIANAGVATYVVENLSPDSYFFVSTAYDVFGNESAQSNVASTTVTE